MNSSKGNKPATRNDLARVGGRILGRLDDKFDRLDGKIDGVEKRLDAKIDGVENRLDAKIDGVEKRLDAKIDGVEKRLDAKIDGVAVRLIGVEFGVKELNAKFDTTVATKSDIAELKGMIQESLALHKDQERANRFFDYKIRQFDKDIAALKQSRGGAG